ncbi:MAG TPA: hypothetical protein VF351_00435, partial [Actinomycetota bacterium]
TDGDRLRSPGTLDPDEMDPFWAEGDVSAVDQLNRLMVRLRRALTSGRATPEHASFLDLRDEVKAEDASSPGARRLRALG